jgi:hypothetical protein
MSVVVTFLIIFSVLVVVVGAYILSYRRRGLPARKDTSSLARGRNHHLSVDILESLFEPRDLQYVIQKCPVDVLVLFRTERKRLALLWLGEIRREAEEAIVVHAERARVATSLEPSTELKLALRYWSLCATCALACAMVHSFGPFRSYSFARYITRLSHRFVAIAGYADTRLNESSNALGGASR